jgi:hypothetical protein
VTTVLIVLAVWFAASIIVGLLAARFIAVCSDDDFAAFLANPRDDDERTLR